MGEGGRSVAPYCIASTAGAMLLPAAVLGTGMLQAVAPSRYGYHFFLLLPLFSSSSSPPVKQMK